MKSEEMSSAAASPSGGKLRIDTMSHEDLQQFAKKQMLMLKNLKNKTDSVTKERDSIKTELSKKTEELSKTSSDLSKKTEEMDCLTMKSKTLEDTLRELQNQKMDSNPSLYTVESWGLHW